MRKRVSGHLWLIGAAMQLVVGCGNNLDGTGSAGKTDGLNGTFFYALPASPGQGMKLELADDGTVTSTRPGGRVQRGTYRRDADKVIVSLAGDGANLIYTLQTDGNLTTIYYGTDTAVFIKQ